MEMPSADRPEIWSRVDDRIVAWGVDAERVVETETSVLVFGRRDTQAVVLKVIKRRGKEWQSGGVLEAFGARGVVKVYEHVGGAMLLERLQPGISLASTMVSGADDDATRVLADTIGAMSPNTPIATVPTVEQWGSAFERDGADGDGQIPSHLFNAARRVYRELCATQARVRLLHGDLHQHNVLFDADRGWVAVDPKGVIGEIEYELGAAMRNPFDQPELFADPSIIRTRVTRLARELRLDGSRILSWAFAQAVLSAVWSIEDGFSIAHDNGSLALANALRPMLPRR
jgi:streptomycin 6-kinase